MENSLSYFRAFFFKYFKLFLGGVFVALTPACGFGDFQKIMWKLNKSIAKELLPTQPVDFSIEPWWGVCLVNFTLEEFKVNFSLVIKCNLPVCRNECLIGNCV